MLQHKFKFKLFLATILLCVSCQKEELNSEDLEQQKQELTKEAKATLEYLTEKGFNIYDLTPNFERKTFVYQGDIDIPFDLKFNIDESNLDEEDSQLKNQWFFGGSGVYYSNSRDITYYVENNFPNYLVNSLGWATYHWSRVSPNINYRRTYNRNSADILVGAYYNSNDGAWARAAIPSGNGNVGSWVSVNTAQPLNTASPETTMTLLIHEFGHNLGYYHSDSNDGGRIPGTRDATYHRNNNCGSIMKSSVFVCGWRVSATPRWTYDDRIAIDWAYELY